MAKALIKGKHASVDIHYKIKAQFLKTDVGKMIQLLTKIKLFEICQ